MDLTESPKEAALRETLRAWLGEHHPGPAPQDLDAAFEWRRAWQRRLHAAGWAGLHWPVEHGGRGATLIESAIFFEELGAAEAPLPVNILGLLLGGPTLMVWGTPEQRDRFLAPILPADEIWCQGFSEPDSGSDLASVKTKAVRDGDGWRVTGQKVWTSLAEHADWCMLLARTDHEVPKHRGLTYMLLRMRQPGVTVRPLRQITGRSEFSEVFIEEARVDDDHIIGGVGNGWKVALTTLMHERAGLAFFLGVRTEQLVRRLTGELRTRGSLEDPAVRERLGELRLQLDVLRLTSLRGLTSTEKHGQPGPEGSLPKWMWSKVNQEATQFAIDVLGPDALEDDGPWSYELLRARGNTIEGGTTETLKNIVAERVLGLPKGR